VGIVLATAWARVVTGHHSVLQVSLGIGVGVISVCLTFIILTP
jgi:membrane-associated phospholipid phosphatase